MDSHQHDAVELLAYKFWQDRDAPIGTPNVDWFRAEKELEQAKPELTPTISAIAKTLGSALGSVVALVTSTEDLIEPHKSWRRPESNRVENQ